MRGQPGPRASNSDGALSLRNVVIVGGGTSGWMCAAALARIAPPHLSITLVESEKIGVVAVGEATIPTSIEFNEFLGLNEDDFLRQCQGTSKLGIESVDWLKPGTCYFHPFGSHGRDTPELAFDQLWLRLRELAAEGAAPPHAAGEISEHNLYRCSAPCPFLPVKRGYQRDRLDDARCLSS